jgi:hydroxymethylpyrimidine pyrophosphatase-like HAD family hydrolase
MKEEKKEHQIKLAIFDFDNTIFYETINETVFEVIQEFKKKKIKLAIASYNPYVKWFCDRYDITMYFDIILGYYNSEKSGKNKHINEIRNYYIEYGLIFRDNEIIFFDDDIHNITDVKKQTNIICIHINPNTGITRDVLKLV